jgi:hypothetical protein
MSQPAKNCANHGWQDVFPSDCGPRQAIKRIDDCGFEDVGNAQQCSEDPRTYEVEGEHNGPQAQRLDQRVRIASGEYRQHVTPSRVGKRTSLPGAAKALLRSVKQANADRTRFMAVLSL